MDNSKNSNQGIQALGFDYVKQDGLPEFYADGVSEAFIGFPISKLTFHSVDGITAEQKESRKGAVRITIPTAALLEMCRNILAQGLLAQPQLGPIYQQSRDNIERILDGLVIAPIDLTPRAGDAKAK